MRSEDFLSYYAARLPTVELNRTFYRQPAAATLEKWAATVPDGFRFAVKAPRTISIFGRVDFAPEFCARLRSLGDRLGAVLVRFDERRARDDDFLRALLAAFDDDLRLALDLRHASWDGVESLLDERAVRVNQLDAPAPFRYLRMREPPYDEAALSGWAERVRAMLDDGLTVHVVLPPRGRADRAGLRGAADGARRRGALSDARARLPCRCRELIQTPSRVEAAGTKPQAHRRVRRPRQHGRGAREHRADELARGLDRAGPAPGVRRVDARPRRHTARHARGRHARGRRRARRSWCARGEWVQYSTPYPGGAEYVAVCLPAFSPDTVNRDDGSPPAAQPPGGETPWA